mmetsp:Transcript_11370/g.16701  ORF Transcript_11370/g.16701 Transcript_11370/m.16701 type:complete len:82 (-) Transcript_11370:51-296(-)
METPSLFLLMSPEAGFIIRRRRRRLFRRLALFPLEGGGGMSAIIKPDDCRQGPILRPFFLQQSRQAATGNTVGFLLIFGWK